MNTPATRQTSEPIDFTASQVCQSLLETTLRTGAQQMLQQAIEAEVANYLRQHREQLDEQGHRLVFGNGHLPARQVQTGLGPVEIRQPRVASRSSVHQQHLATLPASGGGLGQPDPGALSQRLLHGPNGQRPQTDPR